MNFTLHRRGKRVWALLRGVAATLLWLPAPLVLAALASYGALVPTVAAPEEIATATGDVPSVVRSARGLQIGGLERGARPWTPYASISPAFVRAIVASEDVRFFAHEGVDPEGIARAAVANRRAGEVTQGGSTITQQLAKSFVGDDETLDRKLRELVVARRLERLFSKSAIFEAYANRIYFGAGATGVEAAAALYFGTEASALDLAQSATLAAILPAPGRLNPYRHPERVTERRDRVLERLRATGLATDQEVDEALSAPLVLHGAATTRVHAPGVERAVWRGLGQLDERDWRRGDAAIWTDIDLVRQRVAERAAREHVWRLDQRQGWRGALGRVADTEAFERAWADAAFDGEVVPAYVMEAGSALYVWAGERVEVPAEGWAWATPWRDDAENHGEQLSRADAAFEVGDVVLLRARGPVHRTPREEPLSQGAHLVQWPLAETAVVSADLATGHVEALVGGFDADRSAFDRAYQACRQPGSTFKPIVYSAAIDEGLTMASRLRDAPIRIVLGPQEEWRPRNADGNFDGPITVWEAFLWSRNLPALEVYERVGSRATIARARELGVVSGLEAVDSLALGASCLAPTELLEVYGVFARTGRRARPRLIDRVVEDGAVVVESPHAHAAHLPLSARLTRVWRSLGAPEPSVIRPSTAWMTGWLMREVAARGTGAALARADLDVAGKTGTTNAYDAWFAGYSGRDVRVVWVGADRNVRPLGEGESGGALALPLWADAHVTGAVETPLAATPPDGIAWADIEPESGWRATPDRFSVSMPFLRGTEPRRQAESLQRLDAVRMDRVERGER